MNAPNTQRSFIDQFTEFTPKKVTEIKETGIDYVHVPDFIKMVKINKDELALIGDPSVFSDDIDHINKILKDTYFTKTQMVIPRKFRLLNPQSLLEEIDAIIDSGQTPTSLDLTKEELFYGKALEKSVRLEVGADFHTHIRKQDDPAYRLPFHSCTIKDGEEEYHISASAVGACGKPLVTIRLGENEEVKCEPIIFYVKKEEVVNLDEQDKQMIEFQGTIPVNVKLQWYAGTVEEGSGYFLIPVSLSDDSIIYWCLPNGPCFPLQGFEREKGNAIEILKRWIANVQDAASVHELFVGIFNRELMPVDQWSAIICSDICLINKKHEKNSVGFNSIKNAREKALQNT